MPWHGIEAAQAIAIADAGLTATTLVIHIGARCGSHHIAPAVGDHTGCRAAYAWPKHAWPLYRLHIVRVAWSGFLRSLMHVDQGSTERGVGVGKQRRQRHIDKIRIAIILVAVG